jgi:SAM-dependent methyltransferase
MSAEPVPGSFRDPDSQVFIADGQVYRALSERGLAEWTGFSATAAARAALERGSVIGTQSANGITVPGAFAQRAQAILRHDRIPVVSYPYEWSFGMLRDAALLQLALLRSSLDENWILKDSTPYNVQWRGAHPVFIDVGSFQPLKAGEPWVGYRQFCMLFLYPLLLQAYRDLPFQPWLRGCIDGITPGQCWNMMSRRDLLRRGVFGHVYLHAKLDARAAHSDRDVKRDLRSAGFSKQLIAANMGKLEKLVRRLDWNPPRTVWSDYRANTSYSDADDAAKVAFVQRSVAGRRWPLAWDVGANDGRYSRIAAEHADYVLALDADAACVEGLYRALRDEGSTTILPLLMNVVDPSPGLGWAGRERSPLPDRGRPDLVLCLAVVHHVVISGNVPIREFLGWLRSLGSALVIEFPTRDDPMVKRLIEAKREHTHDDYRRDLFERDLSELFDVADSTELPSATRILYRATPRD